jgi:hypothetical protein
MLEEAGTVRFSALAGADSRRACRDGGALLEEDGVRPSVHAARRHVGEPHKILGKVLLIFKPLEDGRRGYLRRQGDLRYARILVCIRKTKNYSDILGGLCSLNHWYSLVST